MTANLAQRHIEKKKKGCVQRSDLICTAVSLRRAVGFYEVKEDVSSSFTESLSFISFSDLCY